VLLIVPDDDDDVGEGSESLIWEEKRARERDNIYTTFAA